MILKNLLGLGQNCCNQARKQRRRPKSLYNSHLETKLDSSFEEMSDSCYPEFDSSQTGHSGDIEYRKKKGNQQRMKQNMIRPAVPKGNQISDLASHSPSMIQALLSFILANFFLSMPATDLFSGMEFPFTVFTVIFTFSLISSKFALKGNLNNLTFVRKFLNLLIILLFAVVLRLTSFSFSFIFHPNFHLEKETVKNCLFR